MFRDIPKLWEGRRHGEDQSLVEDRLAEQQLQIGKGTQPSGEQQLRVTASAVFKDKLYLACSEQGRGMVKVFCLASLTPLPSLSPSGTEEGRAPEGLLPIAPELAQYGSMLASTSPCRRKVTIFASAKKHTHAGLVV